MFYGAEMIINFGKFKGQDIKTIPEDYLAWLAFKHDTFLMNQIAFKEAERRGISKKVLKICLSEWDWEDSEGPDFGDSRGYL
jgi:hypothetical protein